MTRGYSNENLERFQKEQKAIHATEKKTTEGTLAAYHDKIQVSDAGLFVREDCLPQGI